MRIGTLEKYKLFAKARQYLEWQGRYSASAIALAVILTVIYPIQIYLGNPAHFLENFSDLLPGLIAICLVCTAPVVLLGLVFPRRARASLAFILLALSYVVLINGEILIGARESLLDGSLRVIRYSASEAIIYACALVAPFILFYMARRLVIRNIIFLASAAVLTGLAIALITFISVERVSIPRTQPDPVRLTDFTGLSKNENVIHIMLDSLQGDVLLKILNSDYLLRSEFDGFELFIDNAGYSNWTATSFISIFTGRNFYSQDFDSVSPWRTARRRLQDNFLRALEDGGFEVRFLGPARSLCDGLEIGQCDETNRILSNQTERKVVVGLLFGREIAISDRHVELLDATIVRVIPVFLIEHVYNNGRFVFSGLWSSVVKGQARIGDTLDVAMSERALEKFPANLGLFRTVYNSKRAFDRFLDKLHLASNKKRYTFIHFYPPHRPFVFRRDCGLTPIEKGEVSSRMGSLDPHLYEEQARCAVLLLARMMSKLRALGIYDRSTIILQADTGLGVELSGTAAERAANTFRSAIRNYSAGTLVAYSNPALMVKKKGMQGQLRINMAPTALVNTFNSVMKLVGLKERKDLFASFWDAAAAKKSREFVVTERPVLPGMPFNSFEEFVIRGKLREWGNWQKRGLFAGYHKPFRRPQPASGLKVVVQEQPNRDKRTGFFVYADVQNAERAEYMFIVRTLGKDPQSRMLRGYTEANSITIKANEIGKGVDLYVYARASGSVAKYEAKEVVRVAPRK